MKLFMILKFIQILCVYIGMTTVLPFFVLRTTLLRQRLTEKILICFLVGNFYIMNLVFLLQLLHISNQFTLIIGTFVPAFIAWLRINHIDLPEKICHTWHSMKKMAEGELGSKLVLTKMREGLSKRILWLVKYLGKAFAKRPFDWILVLGIFGSVLWYYGIGKLEVYGYNASDTPVHLWWINEMETNHIFVDGVYPFGYHCVIYYLHCIFGWHTCCTCLIFFRTVKASLNQFFCDKWSCSIVNQNIICFVTGTKSLINRFISLFSTCNYF